MIDPSTLHAILSEEAFAFAASMDFPNEAGLTAEQKFQRMSAERPLPSDSIFKVVVEEVFWASTQREEGRPCTPTLLYIEEPNPRQAVHLLREPVALNRHSLRKLSPVQGSRGYLIWTVEDGKPVIVGMEMSHAGDPSNLILRATAPGRLHVEWICMRLFSYETGTVMRLSKNLTLVDEAISRYLLPIFGSFEIHFLRSIVEAIAESGHGGSIWICKSGSLLQKVQAEFETEERQQDMTERFPELQERTAWLRSIGQMAAIDGAVVVNCRMNVIGFGTFVQLHEPRDVIHVTASHPPELKKSDSLGGGRHRAAVEYCFNNAPAAAVVVSADGPISVISRGRDAAILCCEVISLGFTGTLLKKGH